MGLSAKQSSSAAIGVGLAVPGDAAIANRNIMFEHHGSHSPLGVLGDALVSRRRRARRSRPTLPR